VRRHCLYLSCLALGLGFVSTHPCSAADSIQPLPPNELLSLAFQSGSTGAAINEPFAEVPPIPEEDAQPRVPEEEIPASRRFGQETPPVRPPITYLRNEAVLLKRGEMMLDVGVVYSTQQNDFPIVIGANTVTKAKITSRSVYSPLALRYGVTDRLQAQVFLPVGFTSEKVDVLGARTLSDTDGPIGDTVVALNYSLPTQWTGDYNIILTNTFVIPTGEPHYVGLGPDAAFGNGCFEYGTSMLAIRRFDPLLVFGGFGARYGFESKISGVNVERGLAVDYQFGVGFGVNETMSLSAKLYGSFQTQTTFNNVGVPGSERDLIALRFALTKAQPHTVLEPFVTFGLTPDSPDAQLGVILTFR